MKVIEVKANYKKSYWISETNIDAIRTFCNMHGIKCEVKENEITVDNINFENKEV